MNTVHMKAWELQAGDKYRLTESADWVEVTSIQFDRNFAIIWSRNYGDRRLPLNDEVQVIPADCIRRTMVQLKRDIAFAMMENYRAK